MKAYHILSTIGFLLLLSISASAGNMESRIFAKIKTVNNQTLQGYVTWNNRQMYWIDFFNVSRNNNPYSHYFGAKSGVIFKSNNTTSYLPAQHFFCLRFGNIVKIRLNSEGKAEIETRDGMKHLTKETPGSDIGKPISIYTSSQENITVNWDQISEIEFMAASGMENVPIPMPITGIVKTEQGIYKGIITWNKDKITTEQQISGYAKGHHISCPFNNISTIENNKNFCTVTLKNGEQSDMSEYSDVSSQNRGITVNMPRVGMVKIPWSKFELFQTVPFDDINMLSYDDFKENSRLYADVTTQNGTKNSGYIAYDLDENMNYDVLDGLNDNISYMIPFRYIQSIEPKNYKYSFVAFNNGSGVSLGSIHDVNEYNNGILLFRDNNTPVYIFWKDVKTIEFKP